MAGKFISLGGPVLGAIFTRSTSLIKEHAEGLGYNITDAQAIEVWKKAIDILEEEQLEEEITFAIEHLC
jgi:hypothetical protein